MSIIESLNFRPVALPCGKSGATKLYTTNLFSGGCPHACAYCYASGFKNYSTGGLRPISVEAIKNVKKWPHRLFLSSASDPFHPEVIDLTAELLRGALFSGTFVVISTKALATLKIAEIFSQYPDQVSYTVSLSSLSEERNALLEPKAPNADERLHGKWNDNKIDCLGIDQLTSRGIQVTLKADTLFPGIDDTDENISDLLGVGRTSGVEAVTFSYAFYRNKFKKRLTSIPFLRDSLIAMDENQPIASGRGISLRLSEKKKRLARMAHIANDLGYRIISTCECKNQIGSIPRNIPLRFDCHFHDKWF